MSSLRSQSKDLGIHYNLRAYPRDWNPYDNAIAERVNGILKSEFNLWRAFLSYSDAIEPVHKAILNYNTFRPHFSCNLKTPEQTHCRESENTLNSVF